VKWSICLQNGVAAFQVPQVLRFANYKKQQNILKYTSNIGRRTEIKTEESESSLIPTQQVISKLTANTRHW